MRFFTVLFFLSSTWFSCGSEPREIEEDVPDLLGRWELMEARRDNVKTGLLDGLYFEFTERGVFRTNLLTGEPQEGSYQLDESEIYTEGVEIPLTYEVMRLGEEELFLRTRYEGFLFDFLLRRQFGEPHQ